MRPVARFLGALTAVVLVAGCGSTTAAAGSTSSIPAAGSTLNAKGAITVFAAASLTATFTKLGETFKAENPGSDVAFTFAGSSDLVSQITNGAAADVFASADTANMMKVADQVSGTAADFATNTLTIVVPPDNPAGITSFADLARPGVKLVICTAQVPCGSAAKKVETKTGITLSPVSEESSVTDVLGKVTSGEADAGLVYVTDAAGAGDKVTAIGFAESGSAVNTYPIAVLKESANAPLAQKFVDLVTGPEGQAALKAAGFAPAP